MVPPSSYAGIVVDVGERLPRIQSLVAKVKERAAVQLVGTGLRSEVEQTAVDLAKLRGEVAGLQRELRERLHGWALITRLCGIREEGAGDVLAID